MVDLRSPAGDSLVEIDAISYPEGHDLKAAYADRPIKVLSGAVRISIKARLADTAAVGRSIPLGVFIQYQACDDSRCLPPVEQVHEFEVETSH